MIVKEQTPISPNIREFTVTDDADRLESVFVFAVHKQRPACSCKHRSYEDCEHITAVKKHLKAE